jgi:hypothetical protein
MSSDGLQPVTPVDRLDAIAAMSDAAIAGRSAALADELMAIGEATLESWVLSRGAAPTARTVEGFRLLALHRQGSRGDPTFNACRETCRELVYQCNCIRASSEIGEAARLARLAAMVARHLVLFVQGKLEIAGLGEFCCSSRPLRLRETAPAAGNT